MRARGGSHARAVDLAVVLNGFPRLSETFVLHELLELERQGARLHVIALRRPEEIVEHEALGRLRAEVEYLPEPPSAAPLLAVRAAHAALCLRTPKSYLSGLAEVAASPDFSRSSLRQGVYLAHRLLRLGSPPLYLHFAHKPATVGRFAALLAGLPYALSTHAKDIWLTPPSELARKIRDATVVLTCTEEGQQYLTQLSAGQTPVTLAYHGVDVEDDCPQPAPSGQRPVVLCVGRLVAKKGHGTLLRAVAILRRQNIDFSLRIAGDGPQWPRLQRLVHELELGDCVCFLGPLTEDEVRAEYRGADVFALPCCQLDNGDRDGIPNVILEAMAHGLPVVSTTASGVKEAIVHGESGLLAEQEDEFAFAAYLERLLGDRDLRERIGRQARARVAGRFDRTANLPTVLEALHAAGLIPRPRAEAAPPRTLRAVA